MLQWFSSCRMQILGKSTHKTYFDHKTFLELKLLRVVLVGEMEVSCIVATYGTMQPTDKHGTFWIWQIRRPTLNLRDPDVPSGFSTGACGQGERSQTWRLKVNVLVGQHATKGWPWVSLPRGAVKIKVYNTMPTGHWSSYIVKNSSEWSSTESKSSLMAQIVENSNSSIV